MKPYIATYTDGVTAAMTKEDAINAVMMARSPLDASELQRSRAEARGLLALIDEEGLDGLYFENVTIRARRFAPRAVVALVVLVAVALLWLLTR